MSLRNVEDRDPLRPRSGATCDTNGRLFYSLSLSAICGFLQGFIQAPTGANLIPLSLRPLAGLNVTKMPFDRTQNSGRGRHSA